MSHNDHDRQQILNAISHSDMESVVAAWKSTRSMGDCKYILSHLHTKNVLTSAEIIRLSRLCVEDWHERATKVKVGRGLNLIDGLAEVVTLLSWFDTISDDKVDRSAKLALSYLDTLPTTLGQWLRYRNSSEEAGIKFRADLEAAGMKLLRTQLDTDAILASVGATEQI